MGKFENSNIVSNFVLRASDLSKNVCSKAARLFVGFKGFTFVEVMVVMALAAIVSVSLFSSLSLGLRVWKRTASLNYGDYKVVLGLEKLSASLRRVYNYPAIGFFGDREHLEFANILDHKILNLTLRYLPQEGSVYFGQEEEHTPRRLMSGIKDFGLEFYGLNASGNLTFLEAWNYTQTPKVPQAVRVWLTTKEGRAFEKIILIPVGQ